ncbi:late competence development ComFB family protein [bacterium]|nr:late competence development ComFB family protein [bacterium]
MKLKNYMEDAVKHVLDEMLEKRMPDVCKCSRCRLDISAYALNHLPSKYVVTDLGHTFTRVAEMQQQFSADIVVAISKGIKQVEKKPRH